MQLCMYATPPVDDPVVRAVRSQVSATEPYEYIFGISSSPGPTMSPIGSPMLPRLWERATYGFGAGRQAGSQAG